MLELHKISESMWCCLNIIDLIKMGHIIHLSGPRCFPDFGSAVRTVKFTCDMHTGDSYRRFCFPTVLLTLWESWIFGVLRPFLGWGCCDFHGEVCSITNMSHVMGGPVFMPRHQKVAGYYVIPSEILSVRPSVCLSVRPSVRPSVRQRPPPFLYRQLLLQF